MTNPETGPNDSDHFVSSAFLLPEFTSLSVAKRFHIRDVIQEKNLPTNTLQEAIAAIRKILNDMQIT